MLITILAFFVMLVALFGATLLSATKDHGPGQRLVVQSVTLSLTAYTLLSVGAVGLSIAVSLAGVLIGSLIGMKIISYALQYRSLIGTDGEASEWAAELVKEGDQEFIEAAEALSSYDLREVRVLAESKDHLKKLTIERYEEST